MNFAHWQPHYAEHGIATIPCAASKIPLVRNPQKFGRAASAEIAAKFGDAEAFGFYAGPRNGITVLDVDTSDEGVLATALNRHGSSPIIVRTGSGKFHAPYRHNGELRRIRAWGKGLPIDLLGAGLCIAPPSTVTKGTYEIIEGHLDDLDRLPIMRGLDAGMYVEAPSIVPDEAEPEIIPEGTRNTTLWRFCMRQASTHRIETGKAIDRGELIEVARRINAGCSPPLPESEVIAIAASAWGYEISGKNWFGTGQRIVTSHDEIKLLSQDAYYLLCILRQHHWGRQFVVANAMAEKLDWSRKRLAAARAELDRQDKIKMVRKANQWRGAALYDWPPGGADRGGAGREAKGGVWCFL
jgi:Bifunctional DNA primase/polymerase, N-terminal